MLLVEARIIFQEKENTDLAISLNHVFIIYLMEAGVLSVIASVWYHGSRADHSE